MVAVIRFLVVREQDPPAAQIRVLIDDVDLVDLVAAHERAAEYEPAGGYGDLIPTWYQFGPMTDHFLGLGDRSMGGAAERIPVLGCRCGEWGCWPLLARITATPSEVRWQEFAQPFRPAWDYSTIGPFSFDRAQYDEALADLERALAKG